MSLGPGHILTLRRTMAPINIGITMGDPAGVGPRIIAKAIVRPGINKLGRILIIGDRWVFSKIPSAGGFACGEKNQKSPPEADVLAAKKIKNLEFIDLNNVPHKNFKFGKVSPEYGQAAMEYLKKAVGLIKEKQIDCLITAPISKQAINLAGYKYGGHTEFLARAFGKKEQALVMMLLNKYFKISLVTRHLALSKVSPALKQQTIYRAIMVTYKALYRYFAIKNPRLCVAALNPHAGERGLLGKQEINLITPAISRARRLIKNISGPLPADTAMSLAAQGRFNAVIAMYHDQALIPLKLLDFDSGVNLTLGLDFVRTSPLHGTGFDIAAKNIANPNSMISAIKIAVECTKNLNRIKAQ